MSHTGNRIYALLVGINEYPSNVGRLAGCINDVDCFEDYLKSSFNQRKICLEVLKDNDATRDNIIKMFRSHLGKAGSGDAVFFQYSGHGARCKSAIQFKQFYPDGKDEGLVCFDSRNPGGFDLADKELAILLAEIAHNDPHIALLMDCCHSGSTTRGADDFTQARARVTHEVFEERPLETYLDGYYTARLKGGSSLEIPTSKHILLAACERIQKAWESKDHRGVFSATLLDVLKKSGNEITYADLFLRTRSTVHNYADNQTPQFEAYQRFNAYSRFLSNNVSISSHSYSVYFNEGMWQMECGALHGLPSEPDKVTTLELYQESNPTVMAGHAETTLVGAQKSELLLLDFKPNSTSRFQAKLINLPVPPLEIGLEGDANGIGVIQKYLDESSDQFSEIAFITDSNSNFHYILSAHEERFLLQERESCRIIQKARGYTNHSAEHMFSMLKQISAWERAVALQNRSTNIDKQEVEFNFIEILDEDKEYLHPGNEITLDITREGEDWQTIRAKLRANNQTGQPLHFALAYLSDDYGIQVPYNERIEPTNEFFDLIPFGSATFFMDLGENEGDEAIHIFKLIVSTERVDDFLLGQDPIEIGKIIEVNRGGRGVSFGKPRKKLNHKHEWFTHTIQVKLVRRIETVNIEDTKIANNQITIKGHPAFKAGISLNTIQSGSRSTSGDSDFYRALQHQGLTLLNFSGTRGTAENILEFTDIQNGEILKETPLELELDLDLREDEYILPLTFDGEHILLSGEPEKTDDGQVLIHIDHIPEGLPDHRRSLGKALKLYFFKAYLKRQKINALCWVEFFSDGSITRHREGVAEKVVAADKILLLIHGIIGDTEGMAQGLAQSIDSNGKRVLSKFDLVLTYDYENLGTNIEKTARILKSQLRDIGIHEHDDKSVTLLVHSMGGLVSRWFIEQEGGNQVVDHLVMCGTPNLGSPFGKIDIARKLTGVLTTWAINSFPAFTPFGAGLLTVLGRSRKISPTLEQMNPTSEFMQELNAGDDPGIRYTVIAGDIRNYSEEGDNLIANLTSKIGQSFLFDAIYSDAGHDIAVSQKSILGVPNARQPVPVVNGVDCHHMNYFVSEAGMKALAAVEW